MKKALLFLFAMLTVISASALNEVVSKFGEEFNKGHLAYIYANLKDIKKLNTELDGSGFSEMDEALCNYYEAMLSIYIYESIDNKSEKLDLSNRILGENHYMTLSLKALYNKLEKSAITDFDKALLAIQDEVGIDSWQYLSIFYGKAEALAIAGKIKDAANLMKKEQKKFVGTTYENHWMNACIYSMKACCFSNIGKYNDMEEGMNSAHSIMNDIVKEIDNKQRSPLAYGVVAHINYYLASLLRAHDQLDAAMSMSELVLAQLIEMGLGDTGLAHVYRANISEVYYKRGEYDKSRPMMIEYLQYMSKRNDNDKGSQSNYNQIKNLLDKTPVK
ncbi:MAG: hypothetical protein K2I35_01745 [Duncaniella sp.]|nr:hypothetical protein [Duncaniella sp.]